MKQEVLVSVIIPIYNVKAYLAEAIDSVINQTYQHLEIIIVDDGSTDGSGQICDEYAKKDNRIRVVHQKNKGLSGARNTGLDMTTGDYICFLDSDDAYCPDYVQLMLDAITNDETEIVICKWTVQCTTGKLRANIPGAMQPSIEQGFYDRREALNCLADGTIDQSAYNKMYKSTLWQDIRFPEGCVYEDTYTTYRVLDICKRIYVIDKPLYIYRVRPDSITSFSSRKKISDWYGSCDDFDSFVEKNIPQIFTEEQLHRCRQRRIKTMMSLYGRYKEESEEGSKDYLKSFRKQIINQSKEVGLNGCGLETRTLFFILCLCPFLIKPICNMYNTVRCCKSKKMMNQQMN